MSRARRILPMIPSAVAGRTDIASGIDPHISEGGRVTCDMRPPVATDSVRSPVRNALFLAKFWRAPERSVRPYVSTRAQPKHRQKQGSADVASAIPAGTIHFRRA